MKYKALTEAHRVTEIFLLFSRVHLHRWECFALRSLSRDTLLDEGIRPLPTNVGYIIGNLGFRLPKVVNPRLLTRWSSTCGAGCITHCYSHHPHSPALSIHSVGESGFEENQSILLQHFRQFIPYSLHFYQNVAVHLPLFIITIIFA